MRRLWLFVSTLPWGLKLNILFMSAYLGYQTWFDYRHGYLPVNFTIMVLTVILGRGLLPLMIATPVISFKIWKSFATVFLIVSVVSSGQRWWWTVAAHFCREFLLWLYLSCGYWFISQLQLMRERLTSDAQQDQNETQHFSERD